MSPPGKGPRTRARRAVFLDRDGTIVAERHFLRRVADLRLLRGAAAAIARLNAAGYAVVVLSNQSGLARGYFDEHDLVAIHEALAARLARRGARLDAVYVCPHHPDGKVAAYAKACACRKPAKGLLERAVADLGLELRGSAVIGDHERDVALAEATPLVPILVRTGKGKDHEAAARSRLGGRLRVARDLEAAVDAFLSGRVRAARASARGRAASPAASAASPRPRARRRSAGSKG